MAFDRKTYQKAYYRANKERYAASVKAWRKANPGRAKMHSYNNYLRRKAAGYVYNRDLNVHRSYYAANKEALKLRRS